MCTNLLSKIKALFCPKSKKQNVNITSVNADNVTMDNIDAVFKSVISKLPSDIQEHVYLPEGKGYFFIRPQSKHLGVNDFKYCITFAHRLSAGCVSVESLNGGEEAKVIIQQYIDSNSGPNFIKEMPAKLGARNKNKWSWTASAPASGFNEVLINWYVDTITAFWNFFER